MRRRRLLYTTTTALTVALAGCDSTNTDTPQESTATATPDESDPLLEPIQDLWSAYNAEDADGIAETFHPDSPDAAAADDFNFYGTATISGTTVVNQTADSATVEVTVTFTKDGRTESGTQTYELRKHQDEWKIWTVAVESQNSEPAAPQISFDMAYDASATTGTDTAVLTITHEGGDNVDASNLSIQGGGIIAPDGAQPDVTQTDTYWASATGDVEVSAGDRITVGVSSDCLVRVVFLSVDVGSVVLATYEGPDV